MEVAVMNSCSVPVKFENGFGENNCIILPQCGDFEKRIMEGKCNHSATPFENGYEESELINPTKLIDSQDVSTEVGIVDGDHALTNSNNECAENYLIDLPQTADLKPFKCQECGFAFARKNHLDRHTLVHTGYRPFECQTCGGKFSRRSHLKRHALLHNDQNQSTCEECGAAFELKELLESHSLTHKGRKVSDTLLLTDVVPKNEGNEQQKTNGDDESLLFTCESVKPDFAEKCFSDSKQERFEQESCVSETDEKRSGDDNNETYRCSDKLAAYVVQSALPKNGRAPVGERRFKCEECGFAFARKKDLHRHTYIHTGCKPFACDKCGATFSRKYHLKRHANLHHDNNNLTCSNCGVEFTDCVKLDNHVCIQGSDMSLTYFESVSLAGNSQQSVDVPMQESASVASSPKHESDHTFICLECGEAFSHLRQLQCHAATHSQQLQSTPEMEHSTEHEASNLSNANTNPVCLQEVRHAFRNSVIQERPYKCSECFSSFLRPKDLRRHAFIHTGRRPFTCGECGMAFTRNHHLQRHTLTHRDHKPYSCRQCGIRFSRSAHLQRHKLTHIGQNHSSLNCHDIRAASETHENAVSTYNQERANSSFVGNGEKPYPCNECGYPFARKKDLRRHSLIHTGQRPFSCNECGMTFSRKSHLKRHANVHGEKSVVSCEFCGSTFGDEEELYAHTCENAQDTSIKCEKDESSTDGMDLQNGFASLLVETSMTIPDDNAIRVKCEPNYEVGECKEDPTMLGENGVNAVNVKCATIKHEFICDENDPLFEEKLELQHQMLVDRQQNHSVYNENDSAQDHSGRKLCTLMDNNDNLPCISVAHDHLLQEIKPYKCDDCSFSSHYTNDWKRHALTHAGHKSYSCEQCGATFSRMDHLQRHSLVHSSHRPYACSECKATFTQSYHLQRHALVHSRAKLFLCKECDARFARKEDLFLHARTHPSSQMSKSFPADVPLATNQIVPTSIAVAENHISRNRTSKPKLLHPACEKPYKCNICGAAFSWKQTLQQHSVVHTGGKPFQCTRCGDQFALRQHLSVHARAHSASRLASSKPLKKQGCRPRKEKHYKCGVCDATFAYRLSFSNHMRLHTGEKPFSCEICGETFGQNRHLNYHRRENHKED